MTREEQIKFIEETPERLNAAFRERMKKPEFAAALRRHDHRVGTIGAASPEPQPETTLALRP